MDTRVMPINMRFDPWKTNEYGIKTVFKRGRRDGEQVYTDNDKKDALKNWQE